MPSTSSGRIVRSSKGKRGTAHGKNHRWESFTTKVAKFNSLDPLRRVRRHDLDSEDLTTSTSYFKSGLERWQELNVSEDFIQFSQQVTPLSDSLPQILHFQDKIMELLVIFLEKKDIQSIEPVLQLLTEFAHDLGTRFEKFYPRAMKAVIAVAGTSQEVEVLEWCFTCLAFMFKYLSKLLVSDLRPTYDLMAPLLGKERQKPHIARFAAEAMSFLIKKAGAPALRETGLKTVIHHARVDLLSTVESRQYVLYYHGLMTMFAEAIKGNGLTIHSSGPAILNCLFAELEEVDERNDGRNLWADVSFGVLTSLVHHTNSDSFKDVLRTILEQSTSAIEIFLASPTRSSCQRMMLSARMLGVASGVRKGTRVDNWPDVLKNISRILEALSKTSNPAAEAYDKSQLWKLVVHSSSIVLQYAPIDAIIPYVATILDTFAKDPFSICFLAFCSYFAEADKERFRSIVLPYFQRFIVSHWSDSENEDTLCILIPKLVSSGAIIGSFGGKDVFNLPQSWQDHIVSKFERLEISPFPEQAPPATYHDGPKVWHDRCLPKYDALLRVLECTSVHPSANARVAEILLRKLKLALRPSSTLAVDEAHFSVGRGFHAYSRISNTAEQIDASLEPLLLAAAPRYARLPNFLEAMLLYENNLVSSGSSKKKLIDIESHRDDDDLLVSSLSENLSCDSHQLRLLSLRLLEFTHSNSNDSISEVLGVMLLIENTPFDLHNARSTSMHIRKLASMYQHHASHPMLSKAVPSFCFGMLTVRLAQTWDNASAALAQIAQSKIGETEVANLAFKWLEMPSKTWEGLPRNVEQSGDSGLTDFECSNLMRLDQVAVDVESEIEDAQTSMLHSFENEQALVAPQPVAARAQALRVLSSSPHIAEKRSRQLIPMFLSWANDDHVSQGDAIDKEMQGSSDWTRKDQKTLLELLTLFNNPTVLYRSAEVFSALLRLLANGDIDIQRSALKAIFTWKLPSLKPYEENLLNLVDEARFKEEVTILLQDQSHIHPQHRAELMPVLLRVLYGRTIARKGAASGKSGMHSTRLTVLRNLDVTETGAFLDLALGTLKGIEVVNKDGIFEKEMLSVRKQVGFIHMMEAVLKEMATQVAPYTRDILSAVIYCLVYATRRLRAESDLHSDDEEPASQTSMLKVIRQIGFKCLVLLFTNDTQFDWSPFLDILLDELVSPRIEKLPIETAQSISGLLQLLSTWSTSPKTALFLGHDSRILPKVAECLVQPKAQNSVKLFALDIIKHVISVASPEFGAIAVNVNKELLNPNMDTILSRIGDVLRAQHDISKELLEACVDTVSSLAPFVTGSDQAHNLVDISTFLLDQPSRRISPKTKSGLLLVLEHFVPLYDLQDDALLKDRVYNTITSLFGFFKDQTSRQVLSRVLLIYARRDPVLEEVADLCSSLNAFKDGRLDEPDYDCRLKAFTAIVKKRERPFTPYQWRPILFNMLYYIRHDEEFGILSSNSSDGICSFLDSSSKDVSIAPADEVEAMLSSIVLPALYSGAREPSEIIRREYLKVMAHLVKVFPEWSEVNDMCGLLKGDDELESSFFNNILAPGKGRQSSALGQLAISAERGELSSRNASHFFIPLIEHFIFDRAEGNDAHNLAAEATTTVGVLAGSLEWSQYRALLRRFTGYVIAKPELEKQVIRLLGKTIDALSLAAGDRGRLSMDEAAESDKLVTSAGRKSTLSSTMPKPAKFSEEMTSNLLPPLLNYLHDKDESTVSLRVPVAIIVVRLLKLLPQDQQDERLPAVLTDICHILRSKSQESRDLTRDTLTKICVLLGPACFGFVLKELRGALARGYQLHVLSYTMHSILVATTPEYAPGDLDYCLPSIVAIIMDDIFGITGQEKDAEEYVSKMKEVKSSKSHDSMELIAKTATLSRLTDLVHPILVLLKEKLNLRMVRKIDELLNRISTGLLKNPAAQSRDSLIFCYEVIQEVYNSKKPDVKVRENHKLKRYLVQQGAKKSGSRSTSTTVYTYKLVRFGFDVLRSVLKKHDNLRTAGNLAGFVPILGDSLVQAEEEVKVSAFKLLTTIVKVPLQATSNGTDLYKLASTEAIRSITASSTTSSDVSQAALKLISVILRDRTDVKMKDTAIDTLLGTLKEDMTDPERRHVTFNFVRAVLGSKMETAVVYDTLDHIGEVMVTNDDKDTRDLARGAYFQFLREYPQMKKRWSKQLGFIVANLKYEREGGRLSILEVIHLLLSKSANDFVQEVSATCFLPLIFVMVNDDSEKCRMAAGEVIKEIFQKADKERMQTFSTLLRSWIEQTDNTPVLRLAFQCYGLYYDSQDAPDDTDLQLVRESVQQALQSTENEDEEWETLYACLQLSAILCQKFSARLFKADAAEMWAAIRTCLSYPHAWVKLSSARLYSAYFADFAKANSEVGLSLPLRGSNGLQLTASDVKDLIKRMASMFKTPGLTELLATEIVKNLVFLGRCADASSLPWKSADGVSSDEEETLDDEVKQTALNYLFGRLSYILRRETSPPRASMLIPKTAALQVMQILCSKIATATLSPSLQTVLLPLHNLTDPSIPSPYSTDDQFKKNYAGLKSEAQELMLLLQTRCGTSEYTAQLLKVREGVKARRGQRSSKRRIEAVSAPEKYGRDKKKKVDRKKERRKERGMEHRDLRRAY
ncbi:MAG: U3 snoRNP protein [Claussenomyces sp. TS43310]|nr:MAG: U3 snoRNP protein [Claussenomyces sp. TS43310]